MLDAPENQELQEKSKEMDKNKLLISLQEQVASKQWFHSIDFGEFASSGRFPEGQPQNITLYGVFEVLNNLCLKNTAILDLGTYDGLIAFGCHELGASRIYATDSMSRDSFLLARQILQLDNHINYYPNVQISDLEKVFKNANETYFDLIVNAGIFYHMLNPFKAFLETRKLLSEGGLMILETPYCSSKDDAVLVVNNVERIVNEPSTYFVPTLKALIGMAYLSGFKPISRIMLKSPERVTMLLQASNIEELLEDQRLPSFTRQMLLRDICDRDFQFSSLKNRSRVPNVPETLMQVSNFTDKWDIVIDAKTYQPKFPFHVAKEHPNRVGTTRFETPTGNNLEL